MKDLARRFCVPVTQTRPKGARLLEGFSPKLKRRVQLFDYSSFSVWIRLEADPKVVAFCERPGVDLFLVQKVPVWIAALA